MREIYGEKVDGSEVDAETRCAHYHSDLDVIAIKFKCCDRWFPCFQCHAELAGHAAEIWSADEFQTRAILCGGCGNQLRISDYFDCGSICPQCRRQFNPNCAKHYDLYFEVPSR